MLYHIDGHETDVEGSKLKQKHGMHLSSIYRLNLKRSKAIQGSCFYKENRSLSQWCNMDHLL